MPNRMIRESCRTSDTLNQLSAEAERLFWRLTTVADDYGRFEADPRVVLAQCFPLKVGLLKVEAVSKWFAELVACSLVRTYVSGCKQLAFFPTWEKHQYVRAKTSKYPAPADANICSQTPTDSPVVVVTERHGSTEKHEKHGGGPVVMSDDQFLTSLRSNPAYHGIDLDQELAKMDAWLSTPKARGRKKSRQFIVNWLNRVDRPMAADNGQTPVMNPRTLAASKRFLARHQGET